VEAAAQAVLDARAQYPTSTLADLYDPLAMPAPLLKAHQQLDRAVDRCYRPEPFPIAPGYYAYFFWSWIIQVDVENVFDPARPDQKFEVWARIKFEGPRFPHARSGDKDAIYVERVVLVNSE